MTAPYYKYGSKRMNDRTYFTSVVSTSYGDKRYFSNIESEIYFGDQEMTDLYQFEFGIDEKILPIFGYNCYYASELVSGQRIVQGQFVVNYTDTLLIQNTLNSIDDSVYKEITAGDYYPGGDLHHAIYDKQFDITIGYGYYNAGEYTTYNATCQTIIGAKITGMHKVMDTTGQPILEVFTFTAKDFIEENIVEVTPTTFYSSLTNNSGNVGTNFSFVSSDINNTKDIKLNDDYAKTHEGCLHFVHQMVYRKDSGRLSLTIKENTGRSIKLIKGRFEILNQNNSSIVIPLLEAEASGEYSINKQLPEKYRSSMIEMINSGKTIKCALGYEVKSGDKSYTVEDDDAIITIL